MNTNNFFKPTIHGVATEGLHHVTIASTKHIGDTATRFGRKDMQMFVLQVDDQFDKSGAKVPVEIHQQYPRSVHPKSNFYKLLLALEIPPVRVEAHGIDCDDLVGMKFKVIVTHKKAADGVVHANAEPVIPSPSAICRWGDCTNTRPTDKDYCPRHADCPRYEERV